jgi:uncharacterized membrane protein YbhN (UPF0104 family)
VASFAAAWAVGFLLALAPAGVGPREAALVVMLSPTVGQPVALVAAVVSRLLLTGSDILWAAAAALAARRNRGAVSQPHTEGLDLD